MNTFLKYLTIISLSFLIFSCGDDDSTSDQPEPFQAAITFDTFNVNNPITINTGSEVTLSAANSSGFEGSTVEWTVSSPYASENEFFSRTGASRNDSEIVFTPEIAGSYSFTLELRKNGQFSQAFLGFTVEGALEISSVNDLNDLTFENLDGQANPSVADYQINQDFVIPSGTTVQFEPGVTIRFGTNVGFDIQGKLQYQSDGSLFLIGGDQNWKGIRVSGEIVHFGSGELVIYDAGSSSFTNDQEDAAALLIDEGASYLFRATNISNSEGFAVNALGTFTGINDVGYISVAACSKSLKIPSSVLSFYQLNILESEYEPVEVYYDELVDENINLNNLKLRVLDSLVLDAGLQASQAEFNMNPSTYIAVRRQFSNNGYLLISGTTFKGNSDNLADSWRGILIDGAGSTNYGLDLSSCVIKNAGVGLIPGLSVSSAITLKNEAILSMTNTTISDNQGPGITSTGNVVDMRDNTFTNNDQYHLGMGYYDADKLNGNTFDNSANAVEFISNDGVIASVETIPNLGTGNFYVSRVNLEYNGELQLLQGVHIKMDLNTYIKVQGDITASGSQSNPIVIEGLQNSNGFWQGLGFRLDANMNNVDILDGGRLDGATTFGTQFAGGLVVQSAPNRSVSINDCNVSNAGQYGAVIKLGAGDFSIDSTIYNNTFQGSLGAVFDEN